MPVNRHESLLAPDVIVAQPIVYREDIVPPLSNPGMSDDQPAELSLFGYQVSMNKKLPTHERNTALL